ncbi:ATP-binding protein [Aneurinibacillus terranovensis]|uniref:ATP-binding protein n=1 Tax=Aneurinibacillus terranovensis TaxID=278991 RepID=UPI0004217BFD|nr:ATP-binding protein [Aneurinibacillus terranovensis]
MQKVGQEDSTNHPTYECEKCQDKEGYIVRGEDGREYWRFCECREQKKTKRMFKSSQITEEFQKLGFRNFITENRPKCVVDAYETAQDYLKYFDRFRNERKNSIALLGNPGCGKTHLLMAVSNNLMRKGVGVLYFTWVDLLNELKDDFDLLHEKVQRMQKVDVLFIDDLFKGRKEPTPFQLEQLFAIVNYRYLNHLPIMISSERDIDQICEIDEAIGSRIYEMCRDYTVLLQGSRKELNYRLREAN